MDVELRAVDRETAEAIVAGRPPPGCDVAPDYPTEFSGDVARIALGDPPRPPFLVLHDGVVVGEIGAHELGEGMVEIGYAIVPSLWGRGLATAALEALVARLRDDPRVERAIAHAPLDRPGSGRVLEKAGFHGGPARDEEHDGVLMRVRRWELAL